MQERGFAPIAKMVEVMRPFQRPWFFAGGWALDLAAGCVTRGHDDVDVCIFREDAGYLLRFFDGWKPCLAWLDTYSAPRRSLVKWKSERRLAGMMGLTQIPYIWFYESAIICKFDQIWKRPA
ncbi:nucleotidyltransferase domain-containing protein, partial [Alicyclobacillus cellulosilyticus]|uniref:nucleotidyltransferase domain-containing protein n=1 Tax=Alicyclobacillus cellulosilyticus TaxID=1003997 RepID=UPI003570F361